MERPVFRPADCCSSRCLRGRPRSHHEIQTLPLTARDRDAHGSRGVDFRPDPELPRVQIDIREHRQDVVTGRERGERVTSVQIGTDRRRHARRSLDPRRSIDRDDRHDARRRRPSSAIRDDAGEAGGAVGEDDGHRLSASCARPRRTARRRASSIASLHGRPRSRSIRSTRCSRARVGQANLHAVAAGP